MRVQKTIGLAGLLKIARQVEDLVHRHVHQVGGLGTVPLNVVHFRDKVRLSGAAWLQDARWETLKHGRFLFLELVCGPTADFRADAGQAHEDDREKRMMSFKNWLRTDFKAACNWCTGVNNANIVMVQREDGTHTASAKQTRTLVEQAWIPRGRPLLGTPELIGKLMAS